MEFIWTLVVCAGLTPDGGCAAREVSPMPSFEACIVAADGTSMTRADNMQTFATCELRSAASVDDHPRRWRIVDPEGKPL